MGSHNYFKKKTEYTLSPVFIKFTELLDFRLEDLRSWTYLGNDSMSDYETKMSVS